MTATDWQLLQTLSDNINNDINLVHVCQTISALQVFITGTQQRARNSALQIAINSSCSDRQTHINRCWPRFPSSQIENHQNDYPHTLQNRKRLPESQYELCHESGKRNEHKKQQPRVNRLLKFCFCFHHTNWGFTMVDAIAYVHRNAYQTTLLRRNTVLGA